ncbi:Lrp/AsnC family transcriptional regulator [Fodinicurvata halophila]|uniref:Lrp/AsnC family transcriptional regulator n=1 Tax=Fodinicurvata halophila TaxID=1419723 RepID=A0ABV8UIY1_9PROT
MKLDEIDIRILAVLQREGRITKLKLAEKVNLSATPCWERLRRLEGQGVIAGYHARLDLTRLARFTLVLTEITLHRHHQADFQRFEQTMRETPEILECYATGGGIDYLVKVVARDVDHYQRLIDGLLTLDIGIDRYFTYIVTKPIKESREVPLQMLMSDTAQEPEKSS